MQQIAEYRKPGYQVLLGPEISIYREISNGIFVGNLWSADSVDTLDCLDITKVINLTNFDIDPVDGVEFIEFGLPDTEMLDAEIPRMEGKLDNIVKVINAATATGSRVLICCEDGRNKSMLAAAYYLCSIGNPFAATFARLETAYFTPAQLAAENREKRGEIRTDNPEEIAAIRTAREERQKVRALTMKSYCALLRRKFDAGTAPRIQYARTNY